MREQEKRPHIILRDCAVADRDHIYLANLSWEMKPGEQWLITGPNGGGKSTFAEALTGKLAIVPAPGPHTGEYRNDYAERTSLVSFEEAARLIEEERRNDDSDFVEGGIDQGRTPRALILDAFPTEKRANYPAGENLEDHPFISLLGIATVLDRGLKYLSTGEIRRVLLCRALVAQPALLILDEPFDGLDIASRERVAALIDETIKRGKDEPSTSRVLLLMDRPDPIPVGVTHVLEFSSLRASFQGPLNEYERALAVRASSEATERADRERALAQEIAEARERGERSLPTSVRTNSDVLVEMREVTVAWSGRAVLDKLSWTLRRGEHWLIRGPNGSGKTTFLELITGDNPQAYANDVSIFGKRRGSGETVWELKEKMGIVSYRLHLEYRCLADLSLEEVVLSGLHDTIGLYQRCGEEERGLANDWLRLAGFELRGVERFGDLSYGEQRALLIARAAIKCPPILILDEPCHGLDAEHRNLVLKLVSSIAEGGSTTLLHVTHDPTEALPCERHILELRPGESPMYRILERKNHD